MREAGVTQPLHPVAGTFPAFAYGWRGERVYVLYRTGVAENRFGWVEAGQVHRIGAAAARQRPYPTKLRTAAVAAL